MLPPFVRSSALSCLLVSDVKHPFSVTNPGFPRGWGGTPKGSANLLLGQFFAENYENENIRPGRGMGWGGRP